MSKYNPKLAGFIKPKPMKVTVYITVDQGSIQHYTSIFSGAYGSHTKGYSVRPLVMELLSCKTGHAFFVWGNKWKRND